VDLDILVYAVAVLLVASIALFIKAALFDRRPQKVGLLYSLLAAPLYLIYYDDRWPFGDILMREAVEWLPKVEGADTAFRSDLAPAAMVGGLLLVHLTVLQRVAVRQRIQRISDPIANFFAGSIVATLVGGTLVSTFHWGWQGAVIIGVVFSLVYLGALALLAAIVEIVVEVSKLISVWLMRKVFALATWITRISSWISSLSGRLGLNSLVERIRADKLEQEAIFQGEQETQDRELYEAYLRDRARRRRLMQRKGKIGEEAAPEPPVEAPLMEATGAPEGQPAQ